MTIQSIAHSNFLTKFFPFGSRRRGVLRRAAQGMLILGHPRKVLHFVLHIARFSLYTVRELRLDSRAFAYIRQRGLLSFLRNVHARRNSTTAFNEFFYPYWIEVNEKQSDKRGAHVSPQFLIITSELGNVQDWSRLACVSQQAYLNWKLCCFVPRQPKEVVASLPDDKRIVTIFFDDYDSYCEKVNREINSTDCDIVLFWPANFLLAPFALARIAEDMLALDSDFLYADQDKISPIGVRFSPYFKPDFGIESFRSQHYLGDMVAIRRSIFVKEGGLRVGFEGAEIYDLILRAVDNGCRIGHSPRVLSHEQVETLHAKESYCLVSLLDNGEEIRKRVAVEERPSCGNIIGGESVAPKFSLVILNKDAPNYIIPLLKVLTSNERLNVDYEVIIGDTGTIDADVLDYYRGVSAKITIVDGLNYHFSQNNNLLTERHAQGRYVGFLNNDIILQDMDFLDSIEMVFDEIEVGAVGSKLLYPDGCIQHGGVFFFEQGAHQGFPYHRLHGQVDQGQLADMVEEVPAVTGAFLFCRRQEFLDFGGFDAVYAEESQDIDLCLKLRRAGKKIMFLNSPNIIHVENGTRHKGSENSQDRQQYLHRWGAFVETCVAGTPLNRNKFLLAL